MARSLPVLPKFAPPAFPSTPHHSQQQRANLYATPAPHSQYARHTPHTQQQRASPSTAPRATSALRCAACGSTSLRENALGYMICSDCGAQSSEHMALTQEVEEEMFGNMKNLLRGGTRIRRPTTKVAKLTPEEEELVRSQLLLHGFHCLLQHQCRLLIEHFGTPSILVGVVGRIWLGYLAQWRTQPFHGDPKRKWGETHREVLVRRHVPGLNTIHQPGQRGSPVAAAVDGENASLASGAKKRKMEPDEDDAYNQMAASSPVSGDTSRDALQLAPGELSMSLSIAILYVACSLVREPITMQQLCTWVQLGRLTYFNAVRALPPTIAQRVNADHRLSGFFRPQSLPSAHRLLGLANQVSQEVAMSMERQAGEMEQQGDEQAQQAQLTFQQAQQLKRLVTAPAVHAQTSPDHDSEALLSPFPTSTSTSSNSSLLLRTWLEQLRLSSSLHPLVVEIVQKLNIAAVPITKSKAGRRPAVKKAKTEEAHNAEKHVLLMASLVLTVQMTQGAAGSQTTADVPASPASAASQVDRARQLGNNSPAAAAASSSSSAALPSLLSTVAHFTTSDSPPPSSIAANWLSSLTPFPSSLASARSLPSTSEGEFLRWVGEVALARLERPREFEPYVEEMERLAGTGNREEGRTAQKLPAISNGPPSSGALVSRLLACEQVVSYSQNRRGAYHPAYASLLQRCSSLLGVPTATLHAAVQRVIRMAQASTAGAESVYVDTQQQRREVQPAAATTSRDSQSPEQAASDEDDAMEVDEEEEDEPAESAADRSSSAPSSSPPASSRRSSRASSSSSVASSSGAAAPSSASVASSTRSSSAAASKAPTRASSVSSNASRAQLRMRE